MKIQTLAMAVAGMLVGAQAFGVSFTFQENGTGNKGPDETFTIGSVSVTAYGFTIGAPSTPTDLWVKDEGGAESGLGIASDSEKEIDPSHFVQLDLQALIAGNMGLGSVQTGENATIYGSNTLGTLGTLLASLGNAGGDANTYNLAGFAYRYVGVSGGGTAGQDVLITGLSAISRVPDGGMTLMLLGTGLSALGLLRKKFMA